MEWRGVLLPIPTFWKATTTKENSTVPTRRTSTRSSPGCFNTFPIKNRCQSEKYISRWASLWSLRRRSTPPSPLHSDRPTSYRSSSFSTCDHVSTQRPTHTIGQSNSASSTYSFMKSMVSSLTNPPPRYFSNPRKSPSS